ncbi:MAG: N-acetylmuramoyl-L-alanine amidase [Lachnospiraceae bacterium]|nr:N-acetylmuramoyl-L-alanine amidase [Lachnospiraceae bacterium]
MIKLKKIILTLGVTLALASVTACGADKNTEASGTEVTEAVVETETASEIDTSSETETASEIDTSSEIETTSENDLNSESYTETETEIASETEVTTETENNTETETAQVVTGGHIVCIDPGHQTHGNSEQEPIGPGANETKAKVSSGTTGVATGIPEYQMTLNVALKLKEVLVNRGYTVVMTRESNDVNISNAERAAIATNAGAEAFIRLHGNGVNDSSTNGALTMCMTSSNPYNSNLYSSSRRLSEAVVNGLCNATGAANKGVSEVDNMSGINWSTVPVTIVEMGFMTNPTEDSNLNNSDYQYKLAEGMANGVDAYFGN